LAEPEGGEREIAWVTYVGEVDGRSDLARERELEGGRRQSTYHGTDQLDIYTLAVVAPSRAYVLCGVGFGLFGNPTCPIR
jgi:hypothetical protein